MSIRRRLRRWWRSNPTTPDPDVDYCPTGGDCKRLHGSACGHEVWTGLRPGLYPRMGWCAIHCIDMEAFVAAMARHGSPWQGL